MMTAPEVYPPSRKRRKRDRNEDEILVRVSTNQVTRVPHVGDRQERNRGTINIVLPTSKNL